MLVIGLKSGGDLMIRYRRQLFRYGEAAEIYIYPVKETGRKGPRGKRRKPSKACQSRLNNLHRAARLTREIGANFGEGDIFITLHTSSSRATTRGRRRI